MDNPSGSTADNQASQANSHQHCHTQEMLALKISARRKQIKQLSHSFQSHICSAPTDTTNPSVPLRSCGRVRARQPPLCRITPSRVILAHTVIQPAAWDASSHFWVFYHPKLERITCKAGEQVCLYATAHAFQH